MSTMDCFATIESRFADWNYGHPKLLYGFVRALRPKVVVEVGTYRGYAACYLARALQENNFGKLYCMDDFSEGMQKSYGPEHWDDNLQACGVRDWAELIVGQSATVNWPDCVDMAYIDGWHGYLDCKSDFDRCARRGATCIALDDINSTVGPRRLTEEIRASDEWDVIELHKDCGLALCMRRLPRQPLTFSQELPRSISPGTDMRTMTKAERRRHLEEAARYTGVDYSEFEV